MKRSRKSKGLCLLLCITMLAVVITCGIPAVFAQGEMEDTAANGFTSKETATFTNGFYADDALPLAEDLRDQLFFGGLDDHGFRLAVNQMNLEQAGSLESVVDEGQACSILDAICHNGYKTEGINETYGVALAAAGVRAAKSADSPIWPEPGAIKLDKDANAVAGQENLWEVTLGIQGKNYQSTTDVVLVIDQSGSMSGKKLSNTKKAAKAFAEKLLTEGSQTRIAIVTYSNSASTNGIFYTYETKAAFDTAIDAIEADGGTHQQAGIHKADELLYSAASTGVLKNIVLLTDGAATYSYPFVGTASYSDCSSRHILAGQYGGTITNASFVPTVDYTTTVGSGGSFDLYYNAYVDATCSHGVTQRYAYGQYSYNDSGTLVLTTDTTTNNGVGTIWEANQTKAKGTTVYSVALQAGDDGENVLKACATDPAKGYYEIKANDNVEQKLETAFEAIAGSISIAASQGVVTDPMGEKVALTFDGADPVITSNLADYNAGRADVYISQGSAAYDHTTQTIQWRVGNVNEGANPVMKYKVAVKEDVTVQKGEVIDTNKETTFRYKDYQQKDAEDQFPIPKVTIGGGTILVHWYRVNESGQPVNEDGQVVDSPSLAQQLEPAAYFEQDGSQGLDYNTPYTVTPKRFDGYQYDRYILNDGPLTQGDAVTVTLTSQNSNQHVWFSYYPHEETCTLTISKTGSQPVDENQTFQFRVTGADTDTRGVDLIVTVHGNSSITLADLPAGKYTVRELTDWSWRYEPDSMTKEVTLASGEEKTVPFANTRVKTQWLDGGHYLDNRFTGAKPAA